MTTATGGLSRWTQTAEVDSATPSESTLSPPSVERSRVLSPPESTGSGLTAAESTPPPLLRGGVRTHDSATQSDQEPATDVALDLLAAAVTSKVARELGAPRLAVKAARRARDLADTLVIEVSPMLARVSVEAEELVLADVRTTGDLCALLAPERDDDLDRGGAS